MSTETASHLETVDLAELLDEKSSCEGAWLAEPCPNEVTWRLRTPCCGAAYSFCDQCKKILMWVLMTTGGFECRTCGTPLSSPPIWIPV